LSLFSGVSESSIVLLPNAESIYEVPLTLEDSGIGNEIVRKLALNVNAKADLRKWRLMVARAKDKYHKTITVAIVAKYLDNSDTYISVFEALRSASWWNNCCVNIVWIDAVKLHQQKDYINELARCDAIIVPGGFGSRGVEGKIIAAQYALEHDIPYLGLCYGLHMAVIAAARLHGLKKANTTEVDKQTPFPVIDTMVDQKGKENTGGTMRLGNYDCQLLSDSKTAKLYKTTNITERHRHRYECNPKFVDQYQDWGIKAVGFNPGSGLVEVIEGINNSYFVACQFHPEFKSRPIKPHPLFNGLVVSTLQKGVK